MKYTTVHALLVEDGGAPALLSREEAIAWLEHAENSRAFDLSEVADLIHASDTVTTRYGEVWFEGPYLAIAPSDLAWIVESLAVGERKEKDL